MSEEITDKINQLSDQYNQIQEEKTIAINGIEYKTNNPVLTTMIGEIQNYAECNEEKTYTTKDVYEQLGVSKNTLFRWEKVLRLKPRRDWRNWRVYNQEDFETLKEYKERPRN